MKNLKSSLTHSAAGLLTAIVSIVTGLNARAATITWTNTAGGNWSVAANWSPNVVPGALNVLNSSDDVLITNAGTYTVVLDEGTSPNYWDIQSLLLGAGQGHGVQTLAMTNKILYVNPMTITNGGVLADIGSSFHAVITIASGGQLNSTNGTYFANPFTISSGGTFTTGGNTIFESGGSLEVNGVLNILSGSLTLDDLATNSGTMTINSGAGLTPDNLLTLNGPLTNSGTMTVAGGGAIAIANNHASQLGGIVNLAGGSINLNNANGITGGNHYEYLINQGTVNSTGGGSIQSVPGFTNSGAINVSATTLNLDSGLHLQSSGSLNVQLNNALSYGKIVINGTAALTGTFNVTLGNGYNPQNGDTFQPVTYVSHTGSFTATNLPTLVPWQLAYGSSAVTLQVVTQTITWTNTAGGNWSNPNNWNPNAVPGGATYGNVDDVQITAPGTYTVVMDEGTVAAPYYLHGLNLGAGSGHGVQTLVVTNTLPDAASLTVNAGGQVNSAGNYWFNNWVTPLMIASGGVFNSTNDLFAQYVTVNSGGSFTTVNSTNGNGWFDIAGALNVPAGVLTLNGGTTNSGTITVGSGGSLAVNDALVLQGAGGIVNLPGGAINLANGNGISGDNGAEYLSNQGEINSSGGYIQSVPGFTNSGAINALTGTLALDSGLQLQPLGSLNAQLNSAGNYGVFAINGNTALNGTFGVTLNYTPAAGDAFTPLTYSSYSGNFNNYNLPALGTGQSWQKTLGTQALTLQVAESVTWTNTAGGNWSVAANWSPNLVPGQFDDVAIAAPGNYTVVMDPSTVTTRSLTLGTGGGVNGTNTLAMATKTFYVNPLTVGAGGILTNYESAFHGAINVENGGQLNSYNGIYYANPLTIAGGGTLNSPGSDQFHQSLVIGNGGVFNSPGGSAIEYDGVLTVVSGGTVNIPVNVLTLYGPMTNSGTVSMASNGGIYIYNNGTGTYQGYLLNLFGGTINLDGINGIQGVLSQSRFDNQGAVVSAGNGAQIVMPIFDTSAGTVTNLNGTLNLSTFTNTLAGTFYATNGATIRFSGGTATTPLTPGSPLVLAGAGTYQFHTGWLDLPSDIIPNLDLAGGVLELEPTFQGGAITNLALDGIIFTNANALPITGNFSTGNSSSPLAGVFRVNNGGVWNAYGNNVYGPVTIAGGGVLNDDGLVQISPPGSLNVAADGEVNLTNGYLYLYAPATNSGTINQYENNYIYIYGNGTSDLGGLLNQSSGVINLFYSGGISGFDGSDYLSNNGSIIKSVYANITPINVSDFTNSGVITSQTGTLQLNKVTLEPTGSLNSQLNSASDYGKFTISGAAALAGAFNATLNGSYVPVNGATFNVLTYGSYSGNFSDYNLPAMVTWLPQYGSTQFSLVVGLPKFALSLAGTNLVFNANGGTPGNQGVLLTSPNVALPLVSWTPVQTNTFDANGHLTFTNAMDAAQTKGFFILQFP